MKNLNTKLATLTQNKDEIKNLQNIDTKLVSEVLPLLRAEAKATKAILTKEYKAKYPKLKEIVIAKAVTLKRLKETLSTKEPVVNTALNLFELDIKVDYKMSLSKLNLVIKLVRDDSNKVFTKTSVNKASNALVLELLEAHTKTIKLASAKTYVKNHKQDVKPANKATVKATVKTA